MSEQDLTKLKVADLKNMCKEKGLPVSGTKNELIERLSGNTKPTPKPTPKPKSKPTNNLQKPVFNQFLDRKPIIIKRNVHGNFEHPETRLVFSQDKKIIGVQHPEGRIDPITIQDLENVYRYHFEIAEGICVQEVSSSIIAEDESLKQKRIDQLIDMTAE